MVAPGHELEGAPCCQGKWGNAPFSLEGSLLIPFPPPCRLQEVVLQTLRAIGAGGDWESGGRSTKQLTGAEGCSGQRLYRTKLSKDGRILFEVAPEYSERDRVWKDAIRIWLISLSHDSYNAARRLAADSYRKGKAAKERPQLRRQGHPPAGLPAVYSAVGDEAAAGAAAEAKADGRADVAAADGLADGQADGVAAETVVRFTPPANAAKDNYTLLKARAALRRSRAAHTGRRCRHCLQALQRVETP